jgi:hypothetical protein
MNIAEFHAHLQNTDPSEPLAKLQNVEVVATLVLDPESLPFRGWRGWS